MSKASLLENKIALVTGATRGIGQGIAVALAKEGATVIGTGTSEAGAEKISQLFKQHAIKGEGMVLNVNEANSIENLMATIKEKYGAINILVNNAAVTHDNLLLRMKDEE